MIQHLQDIIDRSKEDAIILTFDCGCHRWHHHEQLPPYDVAVLDAKSMDYGEWDASSSSIQTFYSDISSLLSEGISVESHESILNYHLFALISWISFLMDGWYLSLHVPLCDISTHWNIQVTSRQWWWISWQVCWWTWWSVWRQAWWCAMGTSSIKGKCQQDNPWSTPYYPLHLCNQRLWLPVGYDSSFGASSHTIDKRWTYVVQSELL